MKKWLKRIGVGFVLVMAGLQFTNPSHVNPPVVRGHDAFASNAPPAAVTALVKNSCYDCHSYETRWPWYTYVAPVSWFIASHIKDGRAKMNFSEWPNDDPKRARKRWRRVADEIEDGEMPLASYIWIHRKAKLSPEERKQLIEWCRTGAQQ